MPIISIMANLDTISLLFSLHFSLTNCDQQSDLDLADAKEKLKDLTAEVARLKEQIKLKDQSHLINSHSHSESHAVEGLVSALPLAQGPCP